MKKKLSLLSIFFGGLALFGLASISPIQAITPTNMLSVNLSTWYTAQTGKTPDATEFGSYVMTPLNDRLYIGLSQQFSDNDGNALAYFDGTNINYIGAVPEQGLSRIKASATKIYIPGADPNGGNAHDADDIQIYDPNTNTLTQKRYRYSDWHYVDSSTTDANGVYTFANLKPTSYMVKVINPADYRFSPMNQGAVLTNADFFLKPTLDSNVDSTTGQYTSCFGSGDWSPPFTKSWTENTYDAGLYFSSGRAAGTPTSGTRDDSFFTGQYTIASSVWTDTDHDGVQDAGEPGMAGVRVELYTKDPYFPCGVHMNGFWVSPDESEMFASYGFQQAELFNITDAGIVPFGWSSEAFMKSVDSGETWSVQNESDQLYVANDVFKYKDVLYRNYYHALQGTVPQFNDGWNSVVDYSKDNGVTWTKIEPVDIIDTRRIFSYTDQKFSIHRPAFSITGNLTTFHNNLTFLGVGAGTGSSSITQVSTDNQHLNQFTARGPQFFKLIGSWPIEIFHGTIAGSELTDADTSDSYDYNSLVSVNDTYLYVIGKDKKIYISTTGRNWKAIADFSSLNTGYPLSITYWPAHDWIVVATAGSNASLYYLKHSDVVAEAFTTIKGANNLEFCDGFDHSVNLATLGSTGDSDVCVKKNGLFIGQITATLSGTRVDWTTVNGGSDRDTGRAYFYNFNLIPSVGAHPILYVPIPEGKQSSSVIICSGAVELREVTPTCHSGVTFKENETKTVNGASVTVTKVSLDGLDYWAATDINGTGGVAMVDGGNPKLDAALLSEQVAETQSGNSQTIESTPQSTVTIAASMPSTSGSEGSTHNSFFSLRNVGIIVLTGLALVGTIWRVKK